MNASTESMSCPAVQRPPEPDACGARPRVGAVDATAALVALAILDSLHQQIALLDSVGNIVSVNRAWREAGVASASGTLPLTSVGLNYLEVCRQSVARGAGALAAAAGEGVADVLSGARPTFELVYPCHSPTEDKWFSMRVAPLQHPLGGAVVTHEDVTAHWKVDAQRLGLLAELLDLKSAIDEHAIVAITDASGRITYVNDKFCAISKWSREELIGADHRIVNSRHHPKEFIGNLWDTIRAGQVWKGAMKNRAKDGSIYWVDTTIVPLLDSDGRPVQYTAIRAEITERKLLEESNADILAELKAANRELSEFAHVVSHDLKAPLRGISSLASWLVSDHAEALGAEGRQHLNLIASRVKRLSGMIDAILSYSRAGRSRHDRLPMAMTPLVRNVVDLLAPPPNVQIEIQGELPHLHVEAVKMQQILQNLLSNAIDFLDKPQGRVTIDCVRDGAHWHFRVADNGRGIEERHFERIFQLFQTLASRDDNERTGVGLALVKKLVELEGGSVWVESTIGVGTTFHFTVPVEADPAAERRRAGRKVP